MISELQQRVAEALKPSPTPLGEDTLFWSPSDKAPIVYYVRFFGDVACKMNVQANHDRDVARALVAELTPEQVNTPSAERPVVLLPSRALSSTPFTVRALVHPTASQGAVSHATMFMSSVTRITFPAYRCEFTNDDTAEEAAFRLAKVVRWSRWDRAPCPALSARFHRIRSGVKSTGGKRMGIFQQKELETTITQLAKDDGFIDIENFERKLGRIEHANGRYELIVGDDHWPAPDDAVIPWFRILAIDGEEAAKKARAQHVA